MADILRITTPLVNKNQVQQQKQPESDIQFQLSEITRVSKTNEQEGILQQNNQLVDQESLNLLMNQLKDPAATVSFIKGIFLLQEVVKLLPVRNDVLTEEMTTLFDKLILPNGELATEMARQEQSSTIFKGEFFNTLRELVAAYPHPQMKQDVANLLKAVNGLLRNRDILDSVGNNLEFLGKSIAPSKELADAFVKLAEKFRFSDAPENFQVLKKEAVTLLRNLEHNLLFSDKLQKVSSITVYNLSRVSTNQGYLDETLNTLLSNVLRQDDREKIYRTLQQFVRSFTDGNTNKEPSKIMDSMAKLIELQASRPEASLNTEERINGIIHSILSSPCNYTPLLHFVIPMEHMDVRAFAEIWINPNEEDEEKTVAPEGERITHMLIAFEVERMGQFELELSVKGKEIIMQLFCPPVYQKAFSTIGSKIAKAAMVSGYRLSDVRVEGMERPRSLMDVFPTLPQRRAGMNVKI